MKKFTVLILFVFLFFVSTLDAFSRSRFYDLPYGDYKCFKDGETCDYYIYESGSGGHGDACPKLQRGMHPDIHFDAMADFLSSRYCYFTPTRIKKYNCDYSFGHLTVYRKDGKVTSVSGTFPKYMNIQDTYHPENCTEVKMRGGGNLPVNQKPANSHNFSDVQNDNFNTTDNSANNQVSQNFFQTIIPEHLFSIVVLALSIFIIVYIIYTLIFSRRTNNLQDKDGELLKVAKNENINPNAKIDKLFKFKVIAAVLTLLIVIYFHPTEEVLKCNESGICNIKKTYFGIFNIKKDIKVNNNSCLSCSYGMYSFWGRRSHSRSNYGLYIRIDGKAPFVFYVDNSIWGTYGYQMEDLEKSCDKQVERFNGYKNFPELYQYTIKSKASVWNLIFSIVFIALYIIIIFLGDIGKYKRN